MKDEGIQGNVVMVLGSVFPKVGHVLGTVL